MPSPAKLLLVVLLMALMAVVGVFLLGGGAEAPDGGLPSNLPSETAGSMLETPATPVAPPVVRDAAVSRKELVAIAPGTEALDPEERKALAGFTGRVLHHDSAPAAASRVVLFQFHLTSVLAGGSADLLGDDRIDPAIDGGAATTDGEGRFAIRGVWPRGMYLMHAGLGTDNPTVRFVERTPGPGETVDLGDIYLLDGAVLTGVIVDEESKPVAGALVRAIDLPMTILQMVPVDRFDPDGAMIIQEGSQRMVLDMPAWVKKRFDQLPLPTTKTDAEGRFRVTGIPPGNQSLIATLRGFPSVFRQGIKLGPGQERDLGTLEMRMGEEVWGRVLDTAGKPVVGAEVLVGQAGAAGRVFFAVPTEPTNVEGGFSATGFRSGKVVAAARRAPGDAWVITDPQPVVRDLVVRLPATHKLTVRLQSKAPEINEPTFKLLPGVVGDGAVEMSRFGFSSGIDVEARLAELDDGRYVIGDLVPGRYTLLVRCPGHAVTAVRVELVADVEKVVQLEVASSLAVHVVDAAGQPVRSAAVFVHLRGRNRLAELPLPLGKTGAAGFVEAADLPAGRVKVSARHPAYGWAHAGAELPCAKLELAFDVPGALDGVLTDRGRPPELAKWVVLVSHKEGGRGAMPELPRLATPDAEGSFHIEGLRPGEYDVTAMESFQQFTSPGRLIKLETMARFSTNSEVSVVIVGGRTARVQLDTHQADNVVDGPSARVSGTVFVNGRAGTGMVITGYSQRRINARVDEAGRFDFGQVAVGNVHLQLRDPGADPLSNGTLWQKSVEIKVGEDVALGIDLVTESVAGTVIGIDGMPVPGAQVNLQGNSLVAGEHTWYHLSGVSGASGVFELLRVPTGRYSVEAQHEGDRTIGVLEDVEVQPGLSVTGLVVQLRSTVKFQGRVDMSIFANKKPSHVWARLEPVNAGRSSVRWSGVDDDGDFSVEKLVPGTYKVFAWVQYEGGEPGEELVQPTEVVLGPEGQSGVTVRLQRKK